MQNSQLTYHDQIFIGEADTATPIEKIIRIMLP